MVQVSKKDMEVCVDERLLDLIQKNKVTLVVTEDHFGKELHQKLLSNSSRHVLYMNICDAESVLEILPDKKYLLIMEGFGEDDRFENIHIRYQLINLDLQVVVICKPSVLKQCHDPALFFAPIKNGKLQKKMMAKYEMAVSVNSPAPLKILRPEEANPTEVKKHSVKNECFLSKKLMTRDALVMQMVADRVVGSEGYKNFLFGLVYASRTDKAMQVAAANAITALNYARVSFSGMDLSDIEIPHAVLNNLIAHRVNFSGANLSDCTFQEAYLAEGIFNNAKLQDIKFGELPSISWPTGCVTSFCFIPDGKRLITAGDPNNIIIYDIETGQPLQTLIKHKSRVINIVIDSTGKFLISRSQQSGSFETYLWEINTGRVVPIKNHGDFADFILNDKKIIYVREGNIYYANEPEKNIANSQPLGVVEREIPIFTSKIPIETIGYSRDGKLVAFVLKKSRRGKSNFEVQIWDREFKNHLKTLNGYRFCFSPNSYFFAVSALNNFGENIIQVYKLLDFELIQTYEDTHSAGDQSVDIFGSGVTINCLIFSPVNFNILASAGVDGRIILWDLSNGKQEPTNQLIAHNCPVNFLNFSPDGSALVSGGGELALEGHDSGDRVLKFWNVKSLLDVEQIIYTKSETISSLVISEKNKIIITGGNNGNLRCWSMVDGKLLKIFSVFTDKKQEEKKIKQLQIFQGDFQDKLFVLSDVGVVKLFILPGFIEQALNITDKYRARALAISADGKYLAMSFLENKIQILNINSGQLMCECGTKAYVASLVFSTDVSSHLLAMRGVNYLAIIDADTGLQKYNPLELNSPMHYYDVGIIIFSPKNSNLLASYCYVKNEPVTQEAEFSRQASTDERKTKVVLWDTLNKKKVYEFIAHNDYGVKLCFSRDGEYLLSGNVNGEIVVLDINQRSESCRFVLGENQAQISGITFINNHAFLTSQYNGSIKMWEMQNNSNNKVTVNLRWHVPSGFVVRNACFENTRLNLSTQRLLEQNGALVISGSHPLNHQIASGDTAKALEQIKNSPLEDLIRVDDRGWTALHWAIDKTNFFVVKGLVQRSVNLVLVKNKDGVSSLSFALGKGKSSFASFKLMLEALPAEKFVEQLTSFMNSEQGIECYPWFKEYIYHSIRLLRACGEGDLNLVKHLVSMGASVKFREAQYCCTPLIITAGHGHLEIVKWLLANGASADEKNKFGANLLHGAAQQGQTHIVQWLLDNKICQFDQENSDKFIAIDVALDSE